MSAHTRPPARLLGLLAGLALALVCAAPALAQVSPTGSISGAVSDTSGANVPGATVTIRNVETNAEYAVQTSDEGTFTVPSLPVGVYQAAVTATGFKQTVVTNIKVDVGKTANVTVALEVGAVNETVTVESGAEVLETTNTAISTSVSQRQIVDLPFATRDAMQIVLVQPGTQTPGVPRASSINGLPKGSLNITLDGINVQDNLLKSSDGFFTSTQLKADAISEFTLSTATQGAETTAGGAILVAGRTRAGTNDFHGGAFWQHRNTALNANYYFNNLDGLPRDRLILNQFGGNVGGPILKDRLFFFHNYEEFRLPQTYNAARTVLTDRARQGFYTYRDTGGTVREINLFALAAARNATLPGTIRPFPTTPDPTVAGLLNDFAAGVALGGTARSRIANANDFNRFDYNFQTPGSNIRRFPTTRFDWNITPNHQLEFVHHYQQYVSDPDAVNGQLPVVPGAGIVLGSADPITGSIIRNVFSGAIALRSTLSNSLVNEIRGTLGNGGIAIFGQEANPALFSHTRGNALDFPFISDPFTRSTQSRRHTPVLSLYNNLTWTHGQHATTMGGSITRIKSYQDSIGRQAIPLVTFGIAANDPVNTGATSIFTAANFPGSSPAQRTDAGSLYALLTGRVSAITRSASFNPESGEFELSSFVEQNRQKELGFYVQDQWRFSQNLTINAGLRWEIDFAPRNVNEIYTTAGYESVWAVSGEGNLFRPGVFGDTTVPQFRLVTEDDKPYKTRYTDFAPSIGVAWTPDLGRGSVLRAIFGKQGQSVLRGGYSIAFVREGFNTFHLMWGSNEGPTLNLNVTPGTNPAEFGAPGSVLFRDGVLPTRAVPSGDRFPITAGPGASFNEWDPNLRMGYVQSWAFGIQRELTKNTALEIRYVANHGTKLWRQLELNEVNIFENGFLDEFRIAQDNLRIARAANPSSNQFGGLAGQRPIPLISTALGTTNDSAFATTIARGEAGRLASNIAFNTTRMNNLMNAGLIPFTTLSNGARVSNFFIVNPLATGGSFLVVGDGHSTYNAMQVDFRRRFSRGLLFDASYTWAKSLTNMFTNSSVVFAQPTTLRDSGYDKGPSPFDLRHAFKVNAIYELPIGPGRHWLDVKNPVLGKMLEGWQIGGVARIQSGTPLQLLSGRLPFNGSASLTRVDGGVVLHNITRDQLQEMVEIRQTPGGTIFWLPDSVIQNTLAAFELSGTLDPNAPYIGPPTTPGELGARIFLYGPWQKRIDLNVLKRTRITETVNLEFRAQFLNAFNYPNFFIGSLDTVNNPIIGGGSAIGTQFGQTRSAYRDITVSGTNDPGGRLIEFQMRLTF
jgi:hypothetical protein